MKNEKMLSVAVRESKKKNPAAVRIVKRVVMTAFLLIASVVLAAAPLFPGAYPFGIALTAAAPTVSTALTAFVGGVVGSSLIPTVGGQYALLLSIYGDSLDRAESIIKGVGVHCGYSVGARCSLDLAVL